MENLAKKSEDWDLDLENELEKNLKTKSTIQKQSPNL